MVGPSGLEPPTSRLSGVRSNQLSYGPIIYMVGKTGFEPATPWSQTRCSTKLSHFPTAIKMWCRGPESNRYGSLLPQDFKSCASASSATPASYGAENGTRTRDPNLGKVVLYQLSYFRMSTRNFINHEMVRVKGLEPPRRKALDPDSSASANSATPAGETMVSHTGFEPVTP